MDERVAGRVSWGFLRLLLVLIPVAWRTLPAAGVLKVEMAEETQTVFLNDNATILCKASGSSHLDINIMGITWFRESLNETEVKVFEFFGNHQEAFGSGAIVSLPRLKTGDASLQLFGIQLREAGRYRCEMVVTPEKAQGTVYLKVVASPVSVLFQDPATVKDNEDKYILCKSSGFYPKDINITWNKWTQEDPQYLEISEGITTGPIVKNKDGTFNVTSRLRLKPSLDHNMTVYQCVVRHISLPTSQKFNFTLPGIASPVSVLFQDPATVKDNEDKYILCKSSGFYPKDINITWNKWTQEDPQYLEISEGITTGPIVKNKDGTFNVTSRLRLKPSLEHMTVYQCVVRHISLPTSQRFNFTLPGIESEKSTGVWIIVICIGSILVIGLILGLGYFFWKRGCPCNRTLDNDVY